MTTESHGGSIDLGIEQLEVDWLILADHAEVIGGKLYMNGGGWNRVATKGSFPVTKSFSVALAIRVPWTLTNRPHKFEITVQNDDATEALASIGGQIETGRPAGIPPGSSQISQMAANWNVTFRNPGDYVCFVKLNDIERRRDTVRRSLNANPPNKIAAAQSRHQLLARYRDH